MTIVRITLMVALLSVPSTTLAGMAGIFTIDRSQPTTYPGGTNFASFTEAVAALMADGVDAAVVLEAYDDGGSYDEGVTIGQVPGVSADRRVTFRAAPGEEVVIGNTPAPAFQLFAQAPGADPRYITIEGFTMSGFGWYAVHARNADWITIRGCRIAAGEPSVPAIYFEGDAGDYCQFPVITNNMITGNPYMAIALYNAPGAEVDFNSIHQSNSSSWGIWVVSSDGATAPARISNNAVYCVTGLPIEFNSSVALPLTMNHNVWYSEAGYVGRVDGVLHYTIGDWRTATGMEAQSLADDPRFLTSDDLHIDYDSPCFEAGETVPGIETDIDGDLRDSPPEIGADELPRPSLIFADGFESGDTTAW